MSDKALLRAKEESSRGLKGSRLWGALLFLSLFLVDQVTKLIADVYFSAAGAPTQIEIIPGWLSLCIAYNDGIAYGIGDDAAPWVKMFVVALTGVVMLTLAILYCKTDARRTWLRTALIFIVAGGAGNLVDRLYYRVWNPTLYGVRDMVDLSRFGFAVCNFADFFITAGAIMLIAALLFFDKDAMFPQTKKYKALAEEAAQEQEKKKAKRHE